MAVRTCLAQALGRGIVGGFLAAMMCSKVSLGEALEYTLTTNWEAGYRNHAVAQNSLDQDTPVASVTCRLASSSTSRLMQILSLTTSTIRVVPSSRTKHRAYSSSWTYLAGGGDAATLTGSTAVDYFYGNETNGYLRAADNSYYNRANGFDTVTADVSAGAPTNGDDVAYLYDSTGNDTFSATPTTATMDRPAADSVATGFDEVYATATTDAGGGDAATLLGSAGVDYFIGREAYGYLQAADSSYYNRASGFDFVTATGVSSNDTAWLYDSALGDLFTANPTTATFDYGNNSSVEITATSFDQVHADFAQGVADSDVLNLLGAGGADSFIGLNDDGHMTDGATYDFWLWSLDASDTVNADSGDATTGDDTLDVATIDYVFNGSNW